MRHKRLSLLLCAAVFSLSAAAAPYSSADSVLMIKASAVTTETEKTEQQPLTCRITFNPNGGTYSGSLLKNYTEGNRIGKLPLVRKNGYTFRGWYTKKTGGTRVSYNTILKDVKDRTFYAQYAPATHATLKYRFANSNDDFGYDFDYKVPYSDYRYMFTASDARYLYRIYGNSEWGGNCFGMSATSVLFNSGKIKLQSFNEEKYFPKDLKLEDTSKNYNLDLRKFIEVMHNTQMTSECLGCSMKTAGRISSLVNAVKKCQEGKGQPVVIGIQGYDPFFGAYGHAVVGYRWKKINEREERIYVYDCNYPEYNNTYIKLKKSGGKYIGFYYNGAWGEEEGIMDYDLSISYYSFSSILHAWNNRGHNTIDKSLFFTFENADIFNSDGILCGSIKNGVFTSYSDDLYQIVISDSSADGIMLTADSDSYTIVNTDNEEAEVAYFDGDNIVTITTDAETVILETENKNTTVEINASEGNSYDVTYTSDGENSSFSGTADSVSVIHFDSENSEIIS